MRDKGLDLMYDYLGQLATLQHKSQIPENPRSANLRESQITQIGNPGSQSMTRRQVKKGME